MSKSKEYTSSLRAKWSMDGATTLKEAADMLHGFSMYLCELHVAGITLEGPIDGDYAHIVTTSKVKAKKYNLDPREY